jgi:prophage regulatory protein
MTEIISPIALPQATRVLRLPEVMARVGLKRASIYLHMTKGSFPKPINLGPRAVGWLEGDIDAWITARIEVTRRGK